MELDSITLSRTGLPGAHVCETSLKRCKKRNFLSKAKRALHRALSKSPATSTTARPHCKQGGACKSTSSPLSPLMSINSDGHNASVSTNPDGRDASHHVRSDDVWDMNNSPAQAASAAKLADQVVSKLKKLALSSPDVAHPQGSRSPTPPILTVDVPIDVPSPTVDSTSSTTTISSTATVDTASTADFSHLASSSSSVGIQGSASHTHSTPLPTRHLQAHQSTTAPASARARRRSTAQRFMCSRCSRIFRSRTSARAPHFWCESPRSIDNAIRNVTREMLWEAQEEAMLEAQMARRKHHGRVKLRPDPNCENSPLTP